MSNDMQQRFPAGRKPGTLQFMFSALTSRPAGCVNTSIPNLYSHICTWKLLSKTLVICWPLSSCTETVKNQGPYDLNSAGNKVRASVALLTHPPTPTSVVHFSTCVCSQHQETWIQ